MKVVFVFLFLILIADNANAVAVMPSSLDLCKSNKVYVENNLDGIAEYVVYNNEERVFSFSLEPGKRRGVYITGKGGASIEEIAPDTENVINSVDIEVKDCGKKFLTKAIKAAFVALASVVLLGSVIFYFATRKKKRKAKP